MIIIFVMISVLSLGSYTVLSRYPNGIRLIPLLDDTVITANPYPSYLPGHGNLVLYDSLSTSDNWSYSSNISFGGKCQFVNGTYQITQLPPNKIFMCDDDYNVYDNFAFEVKMRIKQGDCGGLKIRSHDEKSYIFKLCQNGNYSFYKYLSNKGSDSSRLTGGNTLAINRGTDRLNVIAVVAKSRQL